MRLSPEAIASCNAIFAAKRHSVHQIVDAVAQETGISAHDIMGESRKATIARARQIVMYEAHLRGLTLNQIGSAMGRHHTTIMHGIRAERARRG